MEPPIEDAEYDFDEYEYDGYYNTRVNTPWRNNKTTSVLGFLLIVLGICSIVWSAVDIGSGSLKNPALNNPNYRNRTCQRLKMVI